MTSVASFHEIRFPEDISYGSSGGPAFNTTIIELSSGHEQRNVNWSEVKAHYECSHGIKTRLQMQNLLDFFYGRNGKAYGFRFKDWMDFQANNQTIGVGDGTTTVFQSVKVYEPAGYPFTRKIRKINPGTMQVYKNGSPVAFTVDNNTGLVTITTNGTTLLPPVLNDQITATFEFDVPVRFDIDDIKITHDMFETMSWPSIPLVEIKPRLPDGTII